MPSRLEKDKDLKHFAENLQRTPEGVRWLKRWKMLNAAITAIQDAARSGDAKGLDLARRSYIRFSDQCSSAIGDLERLHHWPTG